MTDLLENLATPAGVGAFQHHLLSASLTPVPSPAAPHRSLFPHRQDELLTPHTALRAFALFAREFAARAEGNDIFLMAGELMEDTDGGPMDPAAWVDYCDCVSAVTDPP